MAFLDRTKSLCLACSASLPPQKSGENDIFTTNCCRRPICPACIASNPRLSRYDPCLVCLAGVSVVASTSALHSGATSLAQRPWSRRTNLSEPMGAFILGDDDEDEEDLDDSEVKGVCNTTVEIPDNCHAIESAKNEEFMTSVQESPLPLHLPATQESRTSVPYKYYLNRSDTLHGLSLRFGVDVHEICRLNNLPPSIIRTTPHLLHTRSFLILPPSTKPHPSLLLDDSGNKDREEKLVRERAVKKLQTLTKEVDWRVAQAYVALVDDEQDQELFALKRKEVAPCSLYKGTKSTLEVLAIERYLDDLEWETEEMRAGRNVKLLNFPLATSDVQARTRVFMGNVHKSNRWWPWSSS